MTLPEIEKLLQESRKTGRPIEMFDLYGWRPIQENENMSPTLRIAPPPEPREWLIHPEVYGKCKHFTSELMLKESKAQGWIHVREVMEDSK